MLSRTRALDLGLGFEVLSRAPVSLAGFRSQGGIHGAQVQGFAAGVRGFGIGVPGLRTRVRDSGAGVRSFGAGFRDFGLGFEVF